MLILGLLLYRMFFLSFPGWCADSWRFKLGKLPSFMKQLPSYQSATLPSQQQQADAAQSDKQPLQEIKPNRNCFSKFLETLASYNPRETDVTQDKFCLVRFPLPCEESHLYIKWDFFGFLMRWNDPQWWNKFYILWFSLYWMYYIIKMLNFVWIT